MASSFSGIDIGRTGIGFAHYWMDTIGHNLANVNTVRAADDEPFRARLVVAQEVTDGVFAPTGSGVGVGDVVEDDRDPAMVQDPGHPLANEDGYVNMPVVDMAGQLTDLIIANRTYQANARTISGAKEAYESALRIGGGR
jgi:flagellar basal-body rod protein FlgC